MGSAPRADALRSSCPGKGGPRRVIHRSLAACGTCSRAVVVVAYPTLLPYFLRPIPALIVPPPPAAPAGSVPGAGRHALALWLPFPPPVPFPPLWITQRARTITGPGALGCVRGTPLPSPTGRIIRLVWVTQLEAGLGKTRGRVSNTPNPPNALSYRPEPRKPRFRGSRFARCQENLLIAESRLGHRQRGGKGRKGRKGKERKGKGREGSVPC